VIKNSSDKTVVAVTHKDIYCLMISATGKCFEPQSPFPQFLFGMFFNKELVLN